MIMVIIFMIIMIKMIKIKMIMVIIKHCLFVFSDYQDDDHDYGHGDIDFLSLNRIYWRMFEALVNFLQMMYFQLLSPDERKHWGCKILLDCLGRWPNIWVTQIEYDQRKLISNHCRIKLDPIHKVNVCTIFYTISKFECWMNCWRLMQLLCCKQHQSSLRIRPRSKKTDPQSVRDVSLREHLP